MPVSTGISISFNGLAIAEPISLSWTVGGLPRSRSGLWTDQRGTVSVESYGSISTGFRGVRANVVIAGGGMGLTHMAICTDVGATAELGGVTRYSATFQLTDND
jgi:hypothetical protein